MRTIETLRDHLFDTLEALKDPKKSMDLDRAHLICEVSDKIIATAKVEVAYVAATNQGRGSGFLESDPKPEDLPKGITGVHIHRMK